MILLDTNVLSELMQPDPAGMVDRWFSAQPEASVFTSAISAAELRLGAALLPAGKRRVALAAQIAEMLEQEFGGRILSFDSSAAIEYAAIASSRRRNGRPMSDADAQIAAIVRSVGASLATRNVRDFEGCGIAVIDPWTTH